MSIETLTQQIFNQPIGKLIQGFLTERRSRNLSSKTITFYELELKYFTNFLNDKKIASITPDTIRGYLLNLSKNRNAGGCHAAYRAIKAFLNWFEFEFEPENWKNPIRKVKPPENKLQPLPGVSIQDIQKLISVCTIQRDIVLFLVLLDTGVRASELLDLNYGDIDIQTGSIIIQHGKGDKRRIVFVGKKTLRELRKYLKSRLELKKDTPLLATDESTRLSFGGLRQIVRRRSLQAHIEQPGLHDFRRAFALNMLRNGCDLITLSRLLGHSSVAITQKYVAQNEDDLQIVHQKSSPVDNWKF